MENWLDTFEHESLSTPEAQEAFKSAMNKYETKDAAVMGGFEAIKLTGKPFKLPESLDKLPDDTVRGEFTSQVHKILGIEAAATAESLADLDIKAGLAEGVEPDNNLATMLKTFAVKQKLPKPVVQEIVKLWNGPLTEYAKRTSDAKAEAQKVEAATKTNEALIAHFGSEEKVKEQSELLRRVVQNNMGLNAEEYEEFGDAIADSILTKNPVVARGMLTALTKLAAEGTTETGKGSGKEGKPEREPSESPTGKALGWKKRVS